LYVAKLSALTKTLASNRQSYTCSFTIKVTNSKNQGLNNAAVSGTWSTPTGSSYTYSGSTAGKTTSTAGQLTVTFKAAVSARGCTAKVGDVRLAGYTVATDLASLTQSVTW
jgi:hypothetical protein